MKENYSKELVQVAASALAAAQVFEVGGTHLDDSTVGLRGQIRLERLLERVRQERHTQEQKFGARAAGAAFPSFWLLVIMEELGEVAEEVADDDRAAPGFVYDIINLGRAARRILEAG